MSLQDFTLIPSGFVSHPLTLAQSSLSEQEKKEVNDWIQKNLPLIYPSLISPSDVEEQIKEIPLMLNKQELIQRSHLSSGKNTILISGMGEELIITMAKFFKGIEANEAFIFTSEDNQLALGTFYGSVSSEDTTHSSTPFVGVKKVPKIQSICKDILNDIKAHQNTYVNTTIIKNTSYFRVDIGLKNLPFMGALELIIGILRRYQYQIQYVIGQTHPLHLENGTTEEIGASYIIGAKTGDGKPLDTDSIYWGRTVKSLKTLTYVDQGDSFSSLLQGSQPRSLNEANLIRATAHWAHIMLVKINPYYYSLYQVSQVLLKNHEYLEKLLMLFRAKFDPRYKFSRQEKIEEVHSYCTTSLKDVEDEVERTILNQSLLFIEHIVKTNYFVVAKSSLAFHINPICLKKNEKDEVPYAIFFIIGRHYRALHVRYREVARGGMRLILPKNQSAYDAALSGLYDEVNNLAYAQQLKNKDIPEGGSKCAVVVHPEGSQKLAAKGVFSGILDLINHHDPLILNKSQEQELIYVGPDENMSNELIDWVTEEARKRQYPYPDAFMSSKVGFGINHKFYGVTSEGLNVYLRNVLEWLDLKDKPFSIKITGGPDGDVAGNLIKILFRDYKNVKIVAIADGLGAAYDPQGLDEKELLRLVEQSLSIEKFNPALLKSMEAFVISAQTPENIKIRNNLYASVETDIFIPAGGRPFTLTEHNYKNYLNEKGEPSSKAIIEGANIFITPEARKFLTRDGCLIIKDSSANKGGVICSSYEVITCLTLSPDEFKEIKEIYIKEVVDIINKKCDKEAKLLRFESQKSQISLVTLSLKISQDINYLKDILYAELKKEKPQDLNFILERHCPPILSQKYPGRLLERLPLNHQIAIISSYMASEMVYLKGIGWADQQKTPSEIYSLCRKHFLNHG